MNQITINHIHIPASKTLDILSNICAICQEDILHKCNKCIYNNNIQCHSVIGICKHAYHLCCISEWTAKQSTLNLKCPMCSQKWELKKRSIYPDI